ncbi:MAG: hypothetical protein HY716_15290 [Planctomycetes bacterium]|nr:hypothetical protein [Planctomycetota bacterium]
MKPASWLMAGLMAVSSGCIIERHYYGDGPEPEGAVVVESSCDHHESCGHYWYNGTWYHIPGHRHGPGCGHHHDGHRWVLATTVVVPHGHRCTAGCTHYHYNGHWYVIRRHRHGPGCGHMLRGGFWVGVRF